MSIRDQILDIAKIKTLPKWAQELIRRQDQEIAKLKEYVEDLRFKGPSDFYYVNGMDKFPLPEGIVIHIPNGKHDEIMVNREWRKQERSGPVTVRTRESTLRLEPIASNCVYIRTTKRGSDE